MYFLTGCSSTPKKQADPILGEVHPQGTPEYGPVPPPPPKAKETSSVANPSANQAANWDPILSPSPTSNAYLASLTKPLPGSRPLAIEDAPGAFQLTSNTQPQVRPVPKDPAFVNGSWASQPGSSAPGGFTTTPTNFVDPHVSMLQSRGVASHRVDPLPDGNVRLSAVVPQRDNPNLQRTYEVVARDFPAAVLALTQQIDQGR